MFDQVSGVATLGVWGTSISAHPAALSSRLIDQRDLPRVGDTVVVEAVECRGYVHRMVLSLQILFPHKRIRVANHAIGGATSRDVLVCVRRTAHTAVDVALVEVGTNDVLRAAQPGRETEAVGPSEFADNYRQILSELTVSAQRVVCVGSPPVGWSSEHAVDAAAVNRMLRGYNVIASECATEAGAVFVDAFTEFARIAGLRSGWSPESPQPTADGLWHADGLHPSQDLGVELLGSLVVAAVGD